MPQQDQLHRDPAGVVAQDAGEDVQQAALAVGARAPQNPPRPLPGASGGHVAGGALQVSPTVRVRHDALQEPDETRARRGRIERHRRQLRQQGGRIMRPQLTGPQVQDAVGDVQRHRVAVKHVRLRRDARLASGQVEHGIQAKPALALHRPAQQLPAPVQVGDVGGVVDHAGYGLFRPGHHQRVRVRRPASAVPGVPAAMFGAVPGSVAVRVGESPRVAGVGGTVLRRHHGGRRFVGGHRLSVPGCLHQPMQFLGGPAGGVPVGGILHRMAGAIRQLHHDHPAGHPAE